MRILVIGILLIVSAGLYAQQESMATQFAYNKLNYNPAYAGADESTVVSLIIRDQWNGLEGSPGLQMLNLELPLIKQNIALGFNFKNESIGIQSKLTASANYAYLIRSEKSILHVGFNLSYRKHSTDFTDERILAIDGFGQDPLIDPIQQTRHLFNMGVGAHLRFSSNYIGISVKRLLGSKLSDFQGEEERHFYLMAGREIALGAHFRIFPEALLSYVKNAPISANIQLRSLIGDAYLLGVNYRTARATNAPGESVGVMTGFKANNSFLVGVAYDVSLTEFNTSTNGSIELFVRYRFGQDRSIREIVNPRYF